MNIAWKSGRNVARKGSDGNGRMVLAGICALLLVSGLLAGCGGGDQDVETDPTETEAPAEDEAEEVDRPVVPEEEAETEMEGRALPDYSAMAPQEYGVEDVFFEFDKSELTPEAMDTLAKNARILREADVKVLIEGHCDERGTVEYNLALGERRADSVRDYLVSLGVPARNLETVSYGENRPFATGSNPQAWALNRRAHFARP